MLCKLGICCSELRALLYAVYIQFDNEHVADGLVASWLWNVNQAVHFILFEWCWNHCMETSKHRIAVTQFGHTLAGTGCSPVGRFVDAVDTTVTTYSREWSAEDKLNTAAYISELYM